MSYPNQFLVNYSAVVIKSENVIYNLTSYIRQIEVRESIFSPYITGVLIVEDTSQTRFLRSIPIKGGPETSIQFSFNGYEGSKKEEQKSITIDHENYYVYNIKHLRVEGKIQKCAIYFAHRCLYDNEKIKTSLGFVNKNISDIVVELGKYANIEENNWENIEETKNNLTISFVKDNPISQILMLTKYAIRKNNINDVNYLFWQNINSKFNFASLGNLYSQKPTFGTDVTSGFLYANYKPGDYEYTRRLVYGHKSIGKGSYNLNVSGTYNSGILFVDKFFTNGYKYENYDIKKEWNKQTHISSIPFIDNNSKFWDIVDGPTLTKVYNICRHSYCCKEKEGGQRNELFCATRRISQLSQLFQVGVKFRTTGTTNTDEVSAGKIVYFGRPLNYKDQDVEQEDIFYSGKYLITHIKHIIKVRASPIPKYYCEITAFKDSIGEE